MVHKLIDIFCFVYFTYLYYTHLIHTLYIHIYNILIPLKGLADGRLNFDRWMYTIRGYLLNLENFEICYTYKHFLMFFCILLIALISYYLHISCTGPNIFTDLCHVQIRNASAATRMRRMAFDFAYYMIYICRNSKDVANIPS